MDVMDPAIRRGTFKITTESGSVYTFIATKDIARGVTATGGSGSIKLNRQLIMLSDVVRVGESMEITLQGRHQPLGWTSPVKSIEKIS